MNNLQFQKFLQTNVVEGYVNRRHLKENWSNTRGVFITTSRKLLNSLEGLRALGFRAPNGIGMGYNPLAIDCVTAWDIFKGEYRVFSLTDGVNIKNTYPVNNASNILKFWNYFSEYILQLSPKEKLKFMGLLTV